MHDGRLSEGREETQDKDGNSLWRLKNYVSIVVHRPSLSLASSILYIDLCNTSESLEPRVFRVKRQSDVFC
jgi:hypothetical protein